MRKGVLFRPLSILLAVMMVVSIFTILPVTTASAATTTDTLIAEDFTATTTSYTEFSGVSKDSSAVYAGQSAKDGSGNIQLRSKNSNSGIVSTASGGTVRSVKITVGSGTNTIDVYGSNNAYSAASDLYGNNKGTKIGSLTATGTITPSADYAYVGIRSNSGAIYLSKVEIEWDNGSSSSSAYTVTWKDGDGNTIETDTGVASGTAPSYDGGTPTKTADDYTYTFSGEWSDGTNTYATADLPAVTGDVTYTAQFSRVKNHPVVRWLNYDNEVLATETYDAYDTATYKGTAPTRPDSADYRYSFSGWDPVPAPLTDDTDYVAQYTQTRIPEYTVYWYDNEDDLNVLASEDYKEGATPSYTGATPTKASDGTYNYYFDHKWKDIDSDIVYAEGELPPVADETYYIAQFRSVLASEDTLRTDVITLATTGVTGSSYSSWSNKSLAAESSGITSNAVYAGNSAGGNSAIQLRSNGSTSGIVTTASGGKVTKITVEWNDNTDDGGRTLDIYGDTTAYSSASLLYTNPKGTKLGSLYYKVDNVTTTELTIDGNYTFIGIRSHSGAMYLTEIDITWDTAGAGYTVTWKNGDTTLETDTGVASGTAPRYDGAEPTKESDADYDYTFSGWSSDGGATVCTDTFPAVTADVTYIAQFEPTPIPTHTVEWYNDDDCTDKLGEDTFKEGVRPSFSGTPTKASDGDYSYYFNHQWKDFGTGTVYNEDELPEVTDDAIYIAQYNAVVINKYTVTWADYDGAVLETDTNVIKDSTPAYDGALPSRDDDSDFSYTFAGWSPALAPVTEDVTYTAVYTATPLSMTAKILRTDADTEFYLAGKYYSYGGSTRQFDQDGSFSEAELEYDELYLGQLPVASVDVPSHAVFAHSVYVTGSGTASDPFIFTPNYIYASPDNSGVANGVAVSADGTHTSTVSVDAHPGDGFRKFSKARVTKDTNAALFLQHVDDGALNCSNNYVGVGNGNYGNDYNGIAAIPYTFLDGNDTLYFLGQKGSENVYMFTEELPYSNDLGGPLTAYTVTWNNYDDTELDSEDYYIGQTPSYKGEDDPAKPDTVSQTFTFIGWSSDGGTTVYGPEDTLPAVSGDVTYTAQYQAVDKPIYTVRWYDGDLNELDSETYYEGETPSYKGDMPAKDATASARYVFSNRWMDCDTESVYAEADLPAVSGDTDYIAQFTAINRFTVLWDCDNGEELIEETYDEGEIPVFPNDDPTKPDDGGHTYTFTGWDPVPAAIYVDTIFTAQYSTEYTVWWLDGNGDELASETYSTGDRPAYTGATPTKDSDETYRYVFNGKWADLDENVYEADEIPLMSDDAIYTAQFDRIKLHPYVIWCNYNGDELADETYNEGDTPTYKDDVTPTKPNDTDGTYNYTYVFSGWDPTPAPLTDDAIYTAQFTQYKVYTITWQDADGSILREDTVREGVTPSYGSDPAILSDEYEYTFTGWSPAVEEVTGDATYTAQYDRIKLRPEVRWLNYNGALIATETYNAGDVPTYKGSTPTRQPVGDYRFVFTGWDPVPEEVYDDMDYVAQYRSELIPTYTITWVEHDQTTNSTVKEGDRPAYDGDPAKYFDGVWGYEFIGWTDGSHDYTNGEPLPYASGNAVYTALYQQEPLKDCTVRWINYNGDVLETETVKEGTVAAYKGVSDPTHASDGEHTYVFVGWSPEPSVVLDDIDFTAVFTQAAINTTGIVPTDDDKYYTMLEEKWYEDADGYPAMFYSNGKFEVDGNKLMLADEQVGTISTGAGKAFANTVYVTGLGTYEDPYVFTVNYKYGTNSGANISNGTKVNVSDVNPGDQFIGATRLSIDTDVKNVTFMADPEVSQPAQNNYVGIGQYTYGYAYSSNHATSYNGHGAYDFGIEDENYSYTLYYLGMNADGDAHTFSAVNIADRPDFIGVIGGGDWIIKWHNWDDSELYPDEYYNDGDMPSYKGDTPTRPADETYTYVFGGWDHMLIPVTYSYTYKAKFIEIPKDESQPISDIEWIFPTDGEKTYEMEHLYYSYGGEIKVFPGDGVLTDDGEHVYLCGETVADIGVTFSHEKWSAEFIHTVFVEGTGKHSDPFIFHPNYNFSSTISTIGNGTTLTLGDETAFDGVKSYPGDSYQGNSRIKAGNRYVRFLPEETYHTDQYRYIGIGTDTYGYEYDQTQAYPYTFSSEDKTLWYHGEDDYGYVFAEYPASYQQAFGDPETFTVTWKNYDGTILETDTCYYDDDPTYDGETPVKEGYSRFTYTFSGWKNGTQTYGKDDALPAVTQSVTYTATYTENELLFVGHSLTLSGDIGVNFFLDVTPEELTAGSGVLVKFSWNVEGNVKRSEFQMSTDLTKAKAMRVGNKTYYKATCWVAAAEMTYTIHAEAYINGVRHSQTDDYRVIDYANEILDSPASYTPQGKDPADLANLVKAMLDFGAKAQIVFVRRLNDLANNKLTSTDTESLYYYAPAEVTADTITAKKSNMKDGVEDYGLEYYGTSIIFLSQTTLRHYYRVKDSSLFAAAKEYALASGFEYGTKDGYVYFDKKNIGAADLDTVYNLSFDGERNYAFSVLDYSKMVLDSSMTEPNKTLAQATYWYNHYANIYFGH